MNDQRHCSAFVDHLQIAAGPLRAVLPVLKARFDAGDVDALVFDNDTARLIDLDLRGTLEEVLAREAPIVDVSAPRGPGRPRLGVVSREVSLLPRHWEWLEAQPAGLSATLRRLVDDARKNTTPHEQALAARTAANRFITAMAGNRDNAEEATRALFADDVARLELLTSAWPVDVRDFVLRLARAARDTA
jgi:hypothetical protein